jgi:hypothetical protein
MKGVEYAMNHALRYLALYEVHVPWVGDLPPTSFRPSRRRERPCLKLTVTTAFTVRDFNPTEYAHAGRTIE